MSWRFAFLPGAVPLWLSAIVLAWTAWNIGANRALSDAFEKTRQDGFSLRPSEFAPSSPVQGPNAAEPLRQAMELLTPPPSDLRTVASRFAFHWNDEREVRESWVRLQTWISQNRVVVGSLIEASRREECRFDLDYTKGLSLTPLSLVQLTDCAMLAGCAARFAVAEGRVEDAAAMTIALFRLGAGLADQKVLVSLAMGARVISDATKLVESMVNEDPQIADRLAPIVRRLPAGAFQSALAPAMAFERASMVQVCWPDLIEFMSQIQFARSIGADVSLPRRTLYAPLVPYFKYDLARYCEAMRGSIEAASKPPHLRPFDGSVAAPNGFVSGLGTLEWKKFFDLAVSADARVDLLKAVLGREKPLDRFSGRPLVMRRQGSFSVFYSVGPNGIDDGGKQDDLAMTVR